MTNLQALESLHCSRFTAGISQRYHQIMEWRWSAADKFLRIFVGVLAVLGLWASLKGSSFAWHSEAIAVVSMLIAVALNVVPAGDREKYHGEMFRRWSDLRTAVDAIESKVKADDLDGKPSICLQERLSDLKNSENGLHGQEPAPWPKLLARCEKEERRSIYGSEAPACEDAVTSPPVVAAEMVEAGPG